MVGGAVQFVEVRRCRRIDVHSTNGIPHELRPGRGRSVGMGAAAKVMVLVHCAVLLVAADSARWTLIWCSTPCQSQMSANPASRNPIMPLPALARRAQRKLFPVVSGWPSALIGMDRGCAAFEAATSS